MRDIFKYLFGEAKEVRIILWMLWFNTLISFLKDVLGLW